MKRNKSFQNKSLNKLHLWFPNGNGLSTIWSKYSYSENYDTEHVNGVDAWNVPLESDTVEIMILEAPEKTRNKVFRKFARDSENSVIGHLDMEQWLEIVKILSKQH